MLEDAIARGMFLICALEMEYSAGLGITSRRHFHLYHARACKLNYPNASLNFIPTSSLCFKYGSRIAPLKRLTPVVHGLEKGWSQYFKKT